MASFLAAHVPLFNQLTQPMLKKVRARRARACRRCQSVLKRAVRYWRVVSCIDGSIGPFYVPGAVCSAALALTSYQQAHRDYASLTPLHTRAHAPQHTHTRTCIAATRTQEHPSMCSHTHTHAPPPSQLCRALSCRKYEEGEWLYTQGEHASSVLCPLGAGLVSVWASPGVADLNSTQETGGWVGAGWVCAAGCGSWVGGWEVHVAGCGSWVGGRCASRGVGHGWVGGWAGGACCGLCVCGRVGRRAVLPPTPRQQRARCPCHCIPSPPPPLPPHFPLLLCPGRRLAADGAACLWPCPR